MIVRELVISLLISFSEGVESSAKAQVPAECLVSGLCRDGQSPNAIRTIRSSS